MSSTDPALLALTLIKGLGPVTARNLIAYCGSADAIFHLSSSKLRKIPGIGAKTAEALAKPPIAQAEQEIRYCERSGIRILCYQDPEYPLSIKSIYDAPLVIYTKGNAKLNEQHGIAIVGTRQPSEEGKSIAAQFAAYLAVRNINVISGLAYGVDIAAHRAVLENGGTTTAVLGHGLDRIYPASHEKKAREIEQNGLLLTEYPSSSPLDPGNFPARNRIIAALSRAVVVVEAASSGGALITARFAFDMNREVFAVPGRLQDERSVGCNALIRDQIARLVTHPEEILLELNITHADTPPVSDQLILPFYEQSVPLSDEEEIVLNYLQRGDALMDSISIGTGITVQKLNSLLLNMEFRGMIRQLPGKKFKRL